jgi:hypothetical protein
LIFIKRVYPKEKDMSTDPSEAKLRSTCRAKLRALRVLLSGGAKGVWSNPKRRLTEPWGKVTKEEVKVETNPKSDTVDG